MEEFNYIKFKHPKSEPVTESSRFENAVVEILSTILPKANPDFDKLIDQVDYWLVEYNRTENAVWREIGFDKNDQSIVAMPLGKNYGYWTDNNLTLDDFEAFGVTAIS
tara:strand:+ start:2491 stop:2814 length:324 start_codon:yes stop_codon:yes gene_type:complete